MNALRQPELKNILLAALLIVTLALLALPARAATLAWNNLSGGVWSNPANWTPHQVPAPGDTALITNASGSFTVTVDVNSSVSNLTVGGGAAGVQTLQISNGVSLSLGNFLTTAGNGPVMVASGGVLNLATSVSLSCMLATAGTLNLSNTSISVFNFSTVAANGGIVNQSGGLVDFRGDANILPAFGGGEGYFINQGTLRKSSGVGLSTINLSNFDNSMGSVDAESGTLLLEKFVGAISGNFNAASAATIQLSGGTLAVPLVPGNPLVLGGSGQYIFPSGFLFLPADIIPGLVMQGGTLELGSNFQGGTVTNLALDGIALTSTNIISGTLSVTNSMVMGTFTVTNGGVLTASGAFLNGVNLSNSLTVLNGGRIHTVGNGLTINNNGSSNNQVSMTVASGGLVQLSDFSASLTLDGPLTNAGAIIFTNTDIFVANNDNPARQGLILNQAGGVINVRGGGTLAGSGGQANFINQGTLQTSGQTPGMEGFNLFSNEGTLHASGGSFSFLSIPNLILQPSGTISVDISGVGNFGRFVFSSGTGTLHLAGAFSADLTNGFIPGFNNIFNVITYNSFSGNFASIILPTNVNWITNFSTNAFSISTPAPPIVLTVSNIVVTNGYKIYDGTTNATLDVSLAKLVGVRNGDSVTLDTSGAVGFFTNKNAGFDLKVIIGGLALSGPDAHKYTLTQPTTTADIFPFLLTVTGVTARSKVYDGTFDATINLSNAVISGVLSNDVVTLDTNGAIGYFNDQHAATGQLVLVIGWTLTGADAGNYQLPDVPSNADGSPLTANISQALVTVTGITANNKIFDGTRHATLNFVNASLSGVISPDDVSLSTNLYAANFATASLGTNITVFIIALNLAGADSTNYSVVPPTGLKADILSGNAPLTLSITTTNGNAYLRGLGGPGQTYVIQSLPALGTGTWSDLSGPLQADGTGEITYTDTAPPSPRFYRARSGP